MDNTYLMAWRRGFAGLGAASTFVAGAAYYYRPDPSEGELLEKHSAISRRIKSPKVRRYVACAHFRTSCRGTDAHLQTSRSQAASLARGGIKRPITLFPWSVKKVGNHNGNQLSIRHGAHTHSPCPCVYVLAPSSSCSDTIHYKVRYIQHNLSAVSLYSDI